jgi:hypothetical protein
MTLPVNKLGKDGSLEVRKKQMGTSPFHVLKRAPFFFFRLPNHYASSFTRMLDFSAAVMKVARCSLGVGPFL